LVNEVVLTQNVSSLLRAWT